MAQSQPPLDLIDAAQLPHLEDPAPKAKSATVPPLADRFFRPVRLAKFAVLAGLSVLVPYLMQRLPDLSSRPEYKIETKRIRLEPEPERPVPVDLVEQVRRQNNLPRELSTLEPQLCQNLARAFSKHPWVLKVVSVKQSYPSEIVVELEYRRPVAMVQVKGGRVPIDTSGCILPSEDFAVSDATRYPTIRLTNARNMARKGNLISEPGMAGAAQVAQLLTSKWSQLELEAIEIAPQTSDSKEALLYLQARGGSRIIWGRPPGTDHPGELTAAQKVARLEKYATEFGGFDRPNGPYEIDIRHWQEITRRPAAKSQASRRDSRTR